MRQELLKAINLRRQWYWLGRFFWLLLLRRIEYSILKINITLTEYIRKRNGVPIGSPKSLRNNLYRSIGAKNFSTFWNYWNPIFGYYLGKWIFKPLKKNFPDSVSLILTFLFCGLIHDGVTTILRGKISWFFTTWFLFMSFAVLLTNVLNHNFSKQSWIIRALINLTIITVCLILTVYLVKN